MSNPMSVGDLSIAFLSGTPFSKLRSVPISDLPKFDLEARLLSMPLFELAKILADPPSPPFDVEAAARAFVEDLSRTPAHKRMNALHHIEEAIIYAAIQNTNGNVSAAARLLRVERKAMERRARKYGARS